MNKQHRIIWSEATQTWVAVAEIAKAHGKTKGLSVGGLVAGIGTVAGRFVP